MTNTMQEGYELEALSKELSRINVTYERDETRIPYREVYSIKEEMKDYLTPRMIELLDKEQFIVRRNVFAKETFWEPKINGSNCSLVVFPGYFARKCYRQGFAFLLGDILSEKHKDSSDYPLLLSFMMEYFSFCIDKKEKAEETFERKNLSIASGISTLYLEYFEKYLEEYQQGLRNYTLEGLESVVSSARGNLCSLEVALGLVDEWEKGNQKEVLELLESLTLSGQRKDVVLQEYSRDSSGFPVLRKKIKNFS